MDTTTNYFDLMTKDDRQHHQKIFSLSAFSSHHRCKGFPISCTQYNIKYFANNTTTLAEKEKKKSLEVLITFNWLKNCLPFDRLAFIDKNGVPLNCGVVARLILNSSTKLNQSFILPQQQHTLSISSSIHSFLTSQTQPEKFNFLIHYNFSCNPISNHFV